MRRFPPPPPRKPDDAPLVTAKDVSVTLNCHTNSIYRYVRDGWITDGVYGVGPRLLRFDEALVVAQIQRSHPHRFAQ